MPKRDTTKNNSKRTSVHGSRTKRQAGLEEIVIPLEPTSKSLVSLAMTEREDKKVAIEEKDVHEYEGPTFRINNVSRTRVNGVLCLKGTMNIDVAVFATEIVRFDDPQKHGYQRPLSKSQVNAFVKYLSSSDNPLFPEVVLNARNNWKFEAYEGTNKNFGYVICNGKATVIDGQHRIAGIEKWRSKSNAAKLDVPFTAYVNLDETEETNYFYTINTTAKKIHPSLGFFLHREEDDAAWIATQLLQNSLSPFYMIGTISGKRNQHRYITLQNIHKVVKTATSGEVCKDLSREAKNELMFAFFNTLRNTFENQWKDKAEFRITHTVGLNALASVAATIFEQSVKDGKVNAFEVDKRIKAMKGFDWSKEKLGDLSGVEGSKELAQQILDHMAKKKRTTAAS